MSPAIVVNPRLFVRSLFFSFKQVCSPNLTSIYRRWLCHCGSVTHCSTLNLSAGTASCLLTVIYCYINDRFFFLRQHPIAHLHIKEESYWYEGRDVSIKLLRRFPWLKKYEGNNVCRWARGASTKHYTQVTIYTIRKWIQCKRQFL